MKKTIYFFLILFWSQMAMAIYPGKEFKSPYPEYSILTHYLKILGCELIGCSTDIYITKVQKQGDSHTIYLPHIDYYNEEISSETITIPSSIHEIYINDVEIKKYGIYFHDVIIKFEFPILYEEQEFFIEGKLAFGFGSKEMVDEFLNALNQYWDNDFKLLNFDTRFNCVHSVPNYFVLFCFGENGVWWEEI